jgi:CelD/BcsL family acetyltransferase involved in cellulose biosynthesis
VAGRTVSGAGGQALRTAHAPSAASPPRRRPRTSRVGHLERFHDLDELLPEWRALYARVGSTNPFANPEWVSLWLKAFVPEGDLRVTTVHKGGELRAVAPLYVVRTRGAHVLPTMRLELPGTGIYSNLPELPEILTSEQGRRSLLQEVVGYLLGIPGWDWVDLSLGPHQGWFEPHWIPLQPAGSGNFAWHKQTRPTVIVPLPPTPEQLFGGLRRNVKESLRRGRNRLARDGHEWQVEHVVESGPELAAAVDEVMRLHLARAQYKGKLRHVDYLTDPLDRSFLHAVMQGMGSVGRAEAHRLRVGSDAVAAMLTLRAADCTYFWVSGFDPAWWDYGPLTLLHGECLRRAIERGDTLANLSVGPAAAKLRWSEKIEYWHDFVLVGTRRRSRVAYAVDAHRRLHSGLNAQRFLRHKTDGG